MSPTIALDASPTSVLRSMRGLIVAARTAYPEVLHVEVRDSLGAVWRLATQDADFSPLDPTELIGRSIQDAEIDEVTGGLHCRLSDGCRLDVLPTPSEASDDPPSWELVAPTGLVLEFGPGLRWRITTSQA